LAALVLNFLNPLMGSICIAGVMFKVLGSDLL